MQTLDDDLALPLGDAERLERENRVLRERLAFYEGFDSLIQDNVAHARELFRLAAQERESASNDVGRVTRDAAERQDHLRAKLELVRSEVSELAKAADGLSRRIEAALDEYGGSGHVSAQIDDRDVRSVAIVAHGVASAHSALSLQRFVASLPHVSTVTAREFAGGVLRLDACVRDPLLISQFEDWESSRPIHLLTERPEVVEFAFGNESG